VLPESSGDATTRDWSVFFWAGLVGIIVTGLIVGMGGDNYWALSRAGGAFGEPTRNVRGPILFLLGGIVVALFDLSALCVMFAGAVIAVLRYQGRD
jgi:hypothetical protein